MMRAFARFAAAAAFAVGCASLPIATHAQVGISITFGTPAYAPVYAPAVSYAPAYPSFTSFIPAGCPAYSAGQWAWNGYNWEWCPATTYVPVGAASLVASYGFTAAIPPATIAVAPAFYAPPVYYAPTAYFVPPAYYAPSAAFYTSPGVNFFVGLGALPLAPQPLRIRS